VTREEREQLIDRLRSENAAALERIAARAAEMANPLYEVQEWRAPDRDNITEPLGDPRHAADLILKEFPIAAPPPRAPSGISPQQLQNALETLADILGEEVGTIEKNCAPRSAHCMPRSLRCAPLSARSAANSSSLLTPNSNSRDRSLAIERRVAMQLKEQISDETLVGLSQSDRLLALIMAVITGSPGAINPIAALIDVAMAMAQRLSPRQRALVADHLQKAADELSDPLN
jgi:hypothetical protein